MYKKLSLKFKIALPPVVLGAIGIIITIIVTTSNTKKTVVEEVMNTTLPGYRDTVLNALTTMMITGSFKEGKKDFLDQMSKIGNIYVVRSKTVDRDYGEGERDEYPSDEDERKVIETGIDIVRLEGNMIQGIYPYKAGANVMGKNCLACHNVKEGTVLGAVSIKIPLDRSFKNINSARKLYIGLGVIGIAVLAGSLFLLITIAIRPLDSLIDKVRQLAEGDLRVTIDNEGKDEIGTLSRHMNSMIRNFHDIVNEIILSVNKVVSVIDTVRTESEKTEDGAKNQSSQASQIATAAEEMSQTITDIARNASVASGSSSEALEIAQNGKKVTEIAVETIGKVHNSAAELSSLIDRLNKRSSEIGDIVTLIKEIADQTNLLALNAAIEAARAGEQGRGFAVVADEVRKLAERTSKATKEIAEMITNIQSETERSVEAMKTGVLEVEEGVRLGDEAKDALEQMVSSSNISVEMVQRIAVAAEQQSAASEEVSQSMENISDITKRTAAATEQIKVASGDLARLASELQGLVSRFTI